MPPWYILACRNIMKIRSSSETYHLSNIVWSAWELPISRGMLPSIFSEEDSPKPRLSDFSDHRRFHGGWGRKIGSWHLRPNVGENSAWYKIKNRNSPKNELEWNTFTNHLNVSKCYLEWLTLSNFDIKNIFGTLSTSSLRFWYEFLILNWIFIQHQIQRMTWAS